MVRAGLACRHLVTGRERLQAFQPKAAEALIEFGHPSFRGLRFEIPPAFDRCDPGMPERRGIAVRVSVGGRMALKMLQIEG